jgi:hypothetical protein
MGADHRVDHLPHAERNVAFGRLDQHGKHPGHR